MLIVGFGKHTLKKVNPHFKYIILKLEISVL